MTRFLFNRVIEGKNTEKLYSKSTPEVVQFYHCKLKESFLIIKYTFWLMLIIFQECIYFVSYSPEEFCFKTSKHAEFTLFLSYANRWWQNTDYIYCILYIHFIYSEIEQIIVLLY